ncbi:hypothetical protein Tco_1446481 [Tanacetum coccineum]
MIFMLSCSQPSPGASGCCFNNFNASNELWPASAGPLPANFCNHCRLSPAMQSEWMMMAVAGMGKSGGVPIIVAYLTGMVDVCSGVGELCFNIVAVVHGKYGWGLGFSSDPIRACSPSWWLISMGVVVEKESVARRGDGNVGTSGDRWWQSGITM